MSNDPARRMFRTLRGFLAGDEPDEPNHFHFSVTLRIHGNDLPCDEISRVLGVAPTYSRRAGDRRAEGAPPYRDDAWHYEPPLPLTAPLEQHIEALWLVVKPAVEFLKSLKQRHQIDVFCSYRSNCDTAGFEISHRSLELFTALEVPLGVSVIVA